MNRMQEWLANAARELGVRVVLALSQFFPTESKFQLRHYFPILAVRSAHSYLTHRMNWTRKLDVIW